jgi:zinc transporter, ZIP family
MLVGVAVFLAGDRLVERRYGSQGTGGAMGIVVGSVVDGVPESVNFEIQLAASIPVGAAFLLACGVAAVLGYAAADAVDDVTGSRMAALAAGGLLAMLTNSLVPFAYDRGGELAGVATVVGFCASLGGT